MHVSVPSGLHCGHCGGLVCWQYEHWTTVPSVPFTLTSIVLIYHHPTNEE